MRDLGRRALLAAGAASLAGCARSPGTDDVGPGGRTPVPGTSAPPGNGPAGPRPPRRRLPAPAWAPGPNEVEPAAKLAAARAVEASGSGRATPRAVTRIVYPQYGGLTADRASVMTVAEQSWRRPGGGLARRTVTVDVRLQRDAGGWRVTDLLPAEVPVRTGAPPDRDVTALLRERRVDLPDAARAELAAGRVDPLVVRALLRLSRSWSMSVSVFAAGHPPEVFGTTSTSNHTRGRAVDIWAVDGRPVVGLALDDDRLRRFLLDVGATGSDEVGGPVVPVGAGAGYFANPLHRDHVHLGFDA